MVDALLTGIEGWACLLGTTLGLWIHEDNHRTQAFSLRLGCSRTGVSTPYSMGPRWSELHMAKHFTSNGGTS